MTQQHILLALEPSGGGSGRHVLDLAARLAKRGHQVHAIYSPTRAEARFTQALTGLGIPVAAIPMRRAPHPSDVGASMALRRYIKANGPFDVLHGHSSKAGALIRLAALGLPGARIYTPHCFRTMDPTLGAAGHLIFGGAERLLAPLSHAIICVAQEELAHARAVLHLKASRLHLVINGVDPPDFSRRAVLRAQFGFAPDAVVVGFLGRYVAQKAPERLLEALALCAKAGRPPFHLAMAGEGPQEAALKAQAAAMGLSAHITWLPGSVGPDAMLAFDLFAMPSAYEAMPYVLLEAAAAGLPIVATRVGGTGATIGEGENGFVVDNWDAGAFAAALARIAGDADLRARMSAASRARAKGFTIDAMTDHTEAVYASARAGRSGQGG